MSLRRLLSRALVPLLAAGSLCVAGTGPAQAAPQSALAAHTVGYDGYSFLIDGKRVNLWSGEFHYFRLPSPELWRDVLTKIKAGGFNAVSLYFDWAYHSPQRGVYDFTGVRDVEKLLKITDELGIYVLARPGPYINAEIDSGGFPGWLTNQSGRARSTAPDYLAASDEWLTRINAIIARHQITDGGGTVITYQIENEFYDASPDAREYMAHLERKAKADGITVPLVGNHNNNYNAGVGALDVDMPDSYPQLFDCSNPTQWRPVQDYGWARAAGKPLGMGEFQGGAFDPWGGPGYDACRKLTGPDFQKVFTKNLVAQGFTQQNFYMLYGGTSWGWMPDPSQVYTSYDYGAAITEARQLGAKYDENKRIGYFLQAVAPLAKTDRIDGAALTSAALTDSARMNPDDHTQFHVLRHKDSTSTGTDSTHLALDFDRSTPPPVSFTYDDVATELQYQGAWSHAGAEEPWTAGDYLHTESFSATKGDSVTVAFTGTAVRWISGRDANHGIANVYLDGELVKTVDTYGATKTTQEVFFEAAGLADGAHTLRIEATGSKHANATGTFVVIDAIDLHPTPAPKTATYPKVPQQPGTAVTLAGRDSKILVANYRLGAQQLQYSTSEIMTHATIGDRDVALLYGRRGEDGETVLRYPAEPKVEVLAGTVASTWDAATGDLRLNYRHDGLARVLVTGGNRPLLLLLGTDEAAAGFWTQQTDAGPLLVRGPHLLRSAATSGTTLALTGDTSAAGDLEVFSTAAAVSWNGKQVQATKTSSGSLLGTVAGPRPVTLPQLTDWKRAAESPESKPDFDDSGWRVADKMTTTSTTQPATLPVLFADEYGFHYGSIWYRGRFRGTGTETGLNLSAITGRAGVYSAWLNGVFLGTSGDPRTTLPIPAGALRKGADNVISVLVENMGHNQDSRWADTHKEARGLTGAGLAGAPLAAITWRIQGTRGGESLTDPVRGSMNNGGLYGERFGWSLPGFPDAKWAKVALPASVKTPGVSWYRTTARLNLPQDQDTSLGIRIDDDPARHYRAEIFVNGWLLGRYVNDVGPQHSFPLPAGILKPNGDNTIAIAVWNADGTTGGLGKVSFESYGTVASPLRPGTVQSPGYDKARYAVPAAPATTVTMTAPNTVDGGKALIVSARIGVRKGATAATGAKAALSVPAGWKAAPLSFVKWAKINPGASVDARWLVVPPKGTLPAANLLTVTATYRQGRPAKAGTAKDSRVLRSLPPAPTATSPVSALPFVAATNGWGPVERNLSNGEAGAGDGKTLTVGGKTYASGLGAHAAGEVQLHLGKRCTRFTAEVGVDDEVSGGSVVFQVLADGKLLYDSQKLTGADGAKAVDVDVTGAYFLSLVVGDAGDGNGQDHADWADARVTCA
jgi:beta-galactosidase GanA